jgi:hypothetical protein
MLADDWISSTHRDGVHEDERVKAEELGTRTGLVILGSAKGHRDGAPGL